MLKNGKYIKEKPIKIGAHYVPPQRKGYSEEDNFIQYVFMGYRMPRKTKVRATVGAYLAMAYFGIVGMIMLVNVLAGLLLG